MATNKQRQRQVARARWERQQARRAAEVARRRKLRIVGGVVVGLVLTGLLGWLVMYIVSNENARDQPQNPPVETTVPSVTLPSEPTPTPTPNTATPTSAGGADGSDGTTGTGQ